MAAAVLLAACTSTVTPKVTKVVIKPGDISLDVGQSQTLTADVQVVGSAGTAVTWSTSAASVATVSSTGKVTAKAMGTAVITATSKADNTKSDSVTVTVLAASAPVINSFDASATSITEGDTVTLSWDATDGVSYALSDGTNDITIAQTATGSVDVTPTATTTYTLTVGNSKGDVNASVTVTVTPAPTAPTIASFAASPDTVVEGSGSSSTLSWDVSGATSLSLSDGTNDITIAQTATGSVDVTPTATTTYTLTASNSQGDTTASATVTVTPASSAPTVNSFTASATDVSPGATVTLSWDVSGAVSYALSDGTNDITIAQTATGSVDVTVSDATTYTLTASNSAGDTTATVDITVKAATITNLTATNALESTVDLAWTATDATSFDVYAVLDTDTTDELLVQSGVTGTSVNVPMPASNRRTLRVYARGVGGDASADVQMTDMVYSTADSDPYSAQGTTPEPPIPGTLRYVLLNADPGAIVGFASDITSLDISGVDIEDIGVTTTDKVDAHLIFRQDVTVSAPASMVTLNGISAADPADPTVVDPFTWESRMMFVMAQANVTLQNVVVQGGTFIFKGGGIRNDGTLTLDHSTVTGNRAWQRGGGIWNNAGASLTLTDSTISNNRAVTEDAEVDSSYNIRDGYTITLSDGGFGGGIYNEPGATVVATNTTFSGNEAKYSGGALYNDATATATFTGSAVTGNLADHDAYTPHPGYWSIGGGIYNGGTLMFSGADFANNTATDLGGGLALDADGTATLDTVLFDTNTANYGGAIDHEHYTGDTSNLVTTAVTFANNTGISAFDNVYDNDVGPAPAPLTMQSVTPTVRPGRFDHSTPEVKRAP